MFYNANLRRAAASSQIPPYIPDSSYSCVILPSHLTQCPLMVPVSFPQHHGLHLYRQRHFRCLCNCNDIDFCLCSGAYLSEPHHFSALILQSNIKNDNSSLHDTEGGTLHNISQLHSYQRLGIFRERVFFPTSFL